MVKRMTRTLATVGTALVLWAAPMVAQAAPENGAAPAAVQPSDRSGVQATPLYCPQTSRPYLATGFGPIAQCTEVITTPDQEKWGRVVLHSPLTGGRSAVTGWLRVSRMLSYTCSYGDGSFATGQISLETAYGPGVWVTRYWPNRGQWGIINLIVGCQFNPNGDVLPRS